MTDLIPTLFKTKLDQDDYLFIVYQDTLTYEQFNQLKLQCKDLPFKNKIIVLDSGADIKIITNKFNRGVDK